MRECKNLLEVGVRSHRACFSDFPHLGLTVNLLHFVSWNKSLYQSESNLDGQAKGTLKLVRKGKVTMLFTDSVKIIHLTVTILRNIQLV